jgi:hypothetical protein
VWNTLRYVLNMFDTGVPPARKLSYRRAAGLDHHTASSTSRCELIKARPFISRVGRNSDSELKKPIATVAEARTRESQNPHFQKPKRYCMGACRTVWQSHGSSFRRASVRLLASSPHSAQFSLGKGVSSPINQGLSKGVISI